MILDIKGFEFPSSCSVCPFDYDLQECVLNADAYGKDYDWCKERSPRCPLLKVEEVQK